LNQENSAGTSIDVKLILAPVAVVMDEKHLRTATSAFEKRQMVVLKVGDAPYKKVGDAPYKLSDIELIREK
jgi:hypothetical protein